VPYFIDRQFLSSISFDIYLKYFDRVSKIKKGFLSCISIKRVVESDDIE
jgi:hypothetical protein